MKFKKILVGLSLAMATVAVASCGENNQTGTDSSASTPSTAPATTQSGSTTKSSSASQANPGGNGSSTGSIDAGSGKVVRKGEIDITSCSGTSESAYAEYNKLSSATSYNVYLKLASEADSAYVKQDEKVVYTQELSSTKMRTDLVGVKAGKYNVKIVPVLSSGEAQDKSSVCELDVVSYDRSGYAHFNNNDGVGAYKNDGTLKDNALVLYVTDDTKNSVSVTVGSKTVTGIGNILNSAGMDCGETGHAGQCKKVSSGKTYYATANENAGIIKALSEANIPLVVRFVGCVSDSGLYKQGSFAASSDSLISGLTKYDSNDYGGSEGDNGHMARIKSGKNITLEGVGTDATIDGWGFHFMCESSAPTFGKSFEVRNLCFMNNPEDAIGMEGVQESGKITASVERCWVHHNTFLKPSISSPAESDKSEGDGSCDFKRGMYFTMAYNYFEYCHKTNLVGSSDSSLQYNISFHHNVWYNCGSRIPLLRQANIHFYNNFVYGDSNDKNGALSYVSSLRANSYMYSENNYYEGCKAVAEDTGGAAKMFGNEFVQCFNGNTGTVVDSREATVASKCAYNGTSYENFDTNSSLFYYNSSTKQSDCYLTTASVAREECIKFSGSQYRTVLNKTTLKTTSTKATGEAPSTAVTVPSTITLPTAKATAVVDNISWTGITGYSSSTGVKFRGVGATFKLDTYATITIDGSGSSTQALGGIFVVAENGEVKLTGKGSAVLAPGVYSLVSCQKDKDSNVTAISFASYDSDALKAQLIANYNKAYNALPSTISYTDECYELVKAAMDAYNALGNFKSEVSTSPVAKFNEYVSLGAAKVVELINAIGTVNKDSGTKITAARLAYDALISISSTATVSNYSTLTAAEASFKSFAVDACKDAITAIGTVTLNSEDAITYARSLYKSLDEDQQALVTNYSTLTAAETALASIKKIANVEALLTNADKTNAESLKNAYDAYCALTKDEQAKVTNSTALSEVKVSYTIAVINSIPETVTTSATNTVKLAETLYSSLSTEEKALVTNYDKYTAAKAVIDQLASTTKKVTFNYDGKSVKYNGDVDTFTFTSVNGKNKLSVTYEGVTYTEGIKIESKTEISFTLTQKTTLTVVTDISKTIKVDGTKTQVTNGVLSITLEAGTHKLTQGDALNVVYISLIPTA